MRTAIIILCLTFYACSVKNIEPELVDEYFFKKAVDTPTVLPTTKELEGVYLVERQGDWEGRVFAQKEIELIAFDNSLMYFNIYRRCILSCQPNDIDPVRLRNNPTLAIQDKIYLELSGFSIFTPFQQIRYGSEPNEYVNVSKGTGRLSKNKKSFSFSYELALGIEPIGTIPYTYTFTKK
jgi:hypothetical protein